MRRHITHAIRITLPLAVLAAVGLVEEAGLRWN